MDASKLGLGHIITTEQNKDAVHMAIAPVIAGCSMKPGAHVGIANGLACFTDKPIGVVDPFLAKSVRKGDKFWLFLYAGTITGLRHEWAHPSFPDAAVSPVVETISDSERWLRDFADNVDADYDEMMSTAESHCGEGFGDYLCEGGKWEGQGTPGEFWEHFTKVTGKNPNTKYGLPGIFSCSC